MTCASAALAALVMLAVSAQAHAQLDQDFNLLIYWEGCECTSSKHADNTTVFLCKAQATAQDITTRIASDGSVDFQVKPDPEHGQAQFRSQTVLHPDGTYEEHGNVTFGQAAIGTSAHMFYYEGTAGASKPTSSGGHVTMGAFMGSIRGGTGFFRGAVGFFTYRYVHTFFFLFFFAGPGTANPTRMAVDIHDAQDVVA